MKICKRCNISRPLIQFDPHKTAKDGLRGYCKPCRNAAQSLYYQKHKLERRSYDQAYYRRNPDKWRDEQLRRKFGITIENYRIILDQQDGKCLICLRSAADFPGQRWLAVDHCHATGQIRGILCHSCNRAVGLFQDNPDLMIKAAQYVQRFKK